MVLGSVLASTSFSSGVKRAARHDHLILEDFRKARERLCLRPHYEGSYRRFGGERPNCELVNGDLFRGKAVNDGYAHASGCEHTGSVAIADLDRGLVRHALAIEALPHLFPHHRASFQPNEGVVEEVSSRNDAF